MRQALVFTIDFQCTLRPQLTTSGHLAFSQLAVGEGRGEKGEWRGAPPILGP